MPPLWQDLRHAVRGLRARPGFSAAVILTLALGLGANAAIFSIVDRLLFRPPALMTHPDRVHRVAFAQSYRGKEYTNNSVPYARYEDLARWTTSFAHVALIAQRKVAVGVGPDAREMSVAAVSASFFQFFTAPPVIGRYFTTAEDAPPDGRPVAVVSYGWWQSRFGGRRDVLGSTVQVGPTVYTVIGVAPRGFTGIWSTQPPVAYVPISSFAAGMATGFSLGGEAWYRTYHWTWADMIAERQPGVSREAATADLTNAFIRSRDVQATVDKDL
ncbi:MAG TPA: ABC transporter permease, partial [Gemmatimonadaceae bacterium]|nr:ABC transporter permease [Gemmatimonadaceae bacterium]